MANSTNLFSEITIDCFHEYWGGEYYDICVFHRIFFSSTESFKTPENRNGNKSARCIITNNT